MLPSPARLRMLFGAAAGPTIGFGHLVRVRSLARALGVAPMVALHGTAATRRQATAAGWRVVDVRADEDVRRLRLDLLVIDDPSSVRVQAWVQRARRLGVPVATVHDLGIAAVESDLLIDGTVAPRRDVCGRCETLLGPRYAILDPAIRAMRGGRPRTSSPHVLIALGGGRTAGIAAGLANAIARRVEDVEIRVASGFVGGRRPALARGVWIDVKDGLASELASASVAVIAGGVTLYEACALGVPAVAVALGPGQRRTIGAIARAGAAIDGGRLPIPLSAGFTGRVAREVERLLADASVRRRLAVKGRELVDGLGAFRVADRLCRLPAAAAARRPQRLSRRVSS